MTTNLTRIAAALLVGAAAISGCSAPQTDAGPGADSARPPELPAHLAGLPLDTDTTMPGALAYEETLTYDPCALHDPTSAAQTSGLSADSIAPGELVTDCTLQTVDAADTLHGAYFRFVTSFVPFEPDSVGDTAPVEVGSGVRAYRSDGGSDCTYQVDMGTTKAKLDGVAIELQVDANQTDRPACEVAQAYIGTIAPKLADPPLRQARQTDPLVTAHSPCTAIRTAVETAPPVPGSVRQGFVEYTEPAVCRVTDFVPGEYGALLPETRATVWMEFGADPKTSADKGVYPPVTIAGRPGIVSDDQAAARPSCTLWLRGNDSAVLDMDLRSPGSTVHAPVLRVQTRECESAKRIAQAYIQAGAV